MQRGQSLPHYLIEASLGRSSDSSVSSLGADSQFGTGVKAGDFLKEKKGGGHMGTRARRRGKRLQRGLRHRAQEASGHKTGHGETWLKC